MIPIKKAEEIQKMRESCAIAAAVLDRMCEYVEIGMNTYDLDHFGKKQIEELGATSACYNYSVGSVPFPAYTCLSLNEEVVHGIGSLKRLIKEGDIIKVDVTISYNGYIGDTARTVMIEPIAEEVRNLVTATEEALFKGIEEAKPSNKVGDISATIQDYIEKRGFSIVRDFCGHGVGRSMHEEPQIPNFGKRNTGPKLKTGMTLAIEPMVNLGKHEVKVAKDGWTVFTKDGKPSAHFEHTVLIGEEGPEILTISKKLAC